MMEDLTKEDIIKIINFYKNKTVELEFSYLVLQLNHKKELEERKKISDSNYKKLQDNFIEQDEQNIKNFTAKINKLKSELEKYKVKKINKKTTGE